jgi:hypothetical protein
MYISPLILCTHELIICIFIIEELGYAVTQLVEALPYKPEVAGSIPDRGFGIF